MKRRNDSIEPSGIPLKIAIGKKYGPAMEMRDAAEAKAYFERLVRHNIECQLNERKDPDRDEAVRVEKINLGYYAGYYDAEARQRVETLFKCAHPIFGSIAENGQPTPDDALCKGLMAGVKVLHERAKQS